MPGIGKEIMAQLCTQTLPTGKTCARFALRGTPYCSAHREHSARQRTAHTLMLVEAIPDMDPASLAALLLETLQDLRARLIPPLHAEAVFNAATLRFEELRDQPECA
jgi:hypothetical protein